MTLETFHDGRVRLYGGDCRAVLASLPAASVDSVVTDPPYHLASIVKRLSKTGAAPIKSNGATGVYGRAARGFMGQTWDGAENGVAIAHDPMLWAEVLRVLKPGGHLVAFHAPKTWHRQAIAIEEAGFEIGSAEIRDVILSLFCRDELAGRFLDSLTPGQAEALATLIETADEGGALAWVFGTGFPKSLDVSKAIDKRRDWVALPRLQQVIRAARVNLGLSQSEAAQKMGLIGAGETLGGGGYMWFESGLRTPTRAQWPALKAALSLGDEFDGCFEEVEREVTGTVDEWKNRSNYALTSKDGLRRDKPASDLALAWEGWGTALKPAFEPIVLARKPLAGTVADTVLSHGTGAINVDGCRVGSEILKEMHAGQALLGTFERSDMVTPERIGRYPANLVHDGSAAVEGAFPQTPPASARPRSNGAFKSVAKGHDAPHVTLGHQDIGGSAARFFYSAKADGDDRVGSMHPTVKPTELMRWLVRLVTPPGGTILDPFAGTGTTGEAALREGFSAVLIEREATFRTDIARRMTLIDAGPVTRTAAIRKARGGAVDHGPLFGGDTAEAAE